jgi:hypothetical protein
VSLLVRPTRAKFARATERPLVQIAALQGHAIQQQLCGCHSAGMKNDRSIAYSSLAPVDFIT